ncbi:MAG: glucosylceramidase, partial [Bacteroidota bacterium]
MKLKIFLSALLFTVSISTISAQQKKIITQWLTKGDSTVLFTLQSLKIPFENKSSAHTVISVDDSKKYQTIDGFGFALTQGSAMPIIRMNAAKRTALLKELFDTEGSHIGISYIRLSIGSSDLNEKIFSYDDMPDGQ